MAYENETKDKILQRMLDATASDIDKREGSVTFDLLSPAALELAFAFTQLDNVLDLGFADTSNGVWLDKRVNEHGIYRKQATKATGQLTIKGTDGTVISAGSRFSTDGDSPVYFVTLADATIGSSIAGEVTVDAEAEEGGTSGNVAANKIVIVVGDLQGVTGVNNAASFNGGTDTETDAALLDRYLESVREPDASGNIYDYKQWAKSVDGVGDAKVFPIWNGNGTVKVVIIDDNGRAPTATIVNNTASFIEAERPIGADVTVDPATEVTITVSATLTLEEGATLTEAQAEIEAGIDAYFKEIAFKEATVRIAKIRNIVYEAQTVKDYSNLTVNGGTTNVTLADGEVAIRGTVTLS